ncbi:filamin-A-like [Oppia nitens]|uniref:filamin-A-like n=1 Tax=Oppia nitens TaxID=1686743 RepID=UPI0023DA06C1|nr:filamin-A-like [Oppia nitens]
MDSNTMSASVITPSGLRDYCSLKQLDNCQLAVVFVPKQSGNHLVNIKQCKHHIMGSPFSMYVCDHEIGDSSKVRITGNGIKSAKTCMWNKFLIDTKNAGYGSLVISFDGPSKVLMVQKDNNDCTVSITYRTAKPGLYVINVKFAENQVPGTPYTINPK